MRKVLRSRSITIVRTVDEKDFVFQVSPTNESVPSYLWEVKCAKLTQVVVLMWFWRFRLIPLQSYGSESIKCANLDGLSMPVECCFKENDFLFIFYRYMMGTVELSGMHTVLFSNTQPILWVVRRKWFRNWCCSVIGRKHRMSTWIPVSIASWW